MHPEILRIHFSRDLPVIHHDLVIYGYGLMLVVGFLAATQLAKWLARRRAIDGEIFVNAALIALVTGVLGARLSHVLENLSDFTRPDRSAWQNFLAMIDLPAGGLTFYGGFLLAFPCLVIYGWYKKVPIRVGMDIVAPCLIVGLGFGRVGCFLNGCCYGERTDSALGVSFPYFSDAYRVQVHDGTIPLDSINKALIRTDLPFESGRDRADYLIDPREFAGNAQMEKAASESRALPVHPTEIYSTITCFMLAGFLLAYLTLPHAPGRAFALMLMLEGGSRFLLEMIRVEPPVLGNFSLSMILGVALMGLGAVFWQVFGTWVTTKPKGNLAAA